MIRITADLDTKDLFLVMKSVYNALTKIKKVKMIELTPSNSKGYHIIIYTTHKYTSEQQFQLRRLIGDDKQRIALDRKRSIGKNTLFSSKRKAPDNFFTSR